MRALKEVHQYRTDSKDGFLAEKDKSNGCNKISMDYKRNTMHLIDQLDKK